MTKLLSVRADPALVVEIDDRSAELGLNRSQYLLRLVQKDLEEARLRRGTGFGSGDLIGAYRTAGYYRASEQPGGANRAG